VAEKLDPQIFKTRYLVRRILAKWPECVVQYGLLIAGNLSASQAQKALTITGGLLSDAVDFLWEV